jgi:hypothetical protein
MTQSSIFISKHKLNIVKKLNLLINSIFTENENFYLNSSLKDYRKIVLDAQNLLNEKNTINLICRSIKTDLTEYLKTDSFLVQSNLYLRASRQTKFQISESVGWHRESFYGSNMEKSVNVWTPLKGVTKNNTLRYIPNSHKIRDSKIKTLKVNSKDTKKFSMGHKIGLVYSPKIIKNGVDLSTSRSMIVKRNYSAIFSGNLIHGSALNLSNKIRFSIDFRVLRKKDYNNHNKKFHYSSKKPYFVEYEY